MKTSWFIRKGNGQFIEFYKRLRSAIRGHVMEENCIPITDNILKQLGIEIKEGEIMKIKIECEPRIAPYL